MFRFCFGFVKMTTKKQKKLCDVHLADKSSPDFGSEIKTDRWGGWSTFINVYRIMDANFLIG